MVKSKIDFPHPVLYEGGEDYAEGCSFHNQFEIKSENELYMDFKAEYMLKCTYLEELIEKEQAAVILYVENSNASFRRIYKFAYNEKSICISLRKEEVSKKVVVKPYIVSVCDISDFGSELFNPDYFRDTVFTIRKGDILAYEKQYEVVIDDIDEFKNCASIFSIRLDESTTDSVKVNYNDEKINVLVNKQDYFLFQELRDRQELRMYLSVMIVFPALVEVIEAMKREVKTGEEGIDSKRWYLAMEKQLERKNIRLNDMSSSVHIANELLGNIFRSSLLDLKTLFNSSMGREET